MNEVVLPELGEGIEEATLACWLSKVGDAVKSDDDIVELVTDKASFNVSAGRDGILKEILAQEGDVIKVGQRLATIEAQKQ